MSETQVDYYEDDYEGVEKNLRLSLKFEKTSTIQTKIVNNRVELRSLRVYLPPSDTS